MSQMKTQIITRYDSPHQFEPLLPSEALMGPLLEQASDLTRKQRLAVAHIQTEAHCEVELDAKRAVLGDEVARWLYSADALSWLHRELFGGLPADDLRLSDGSAMVSRDARPHPGCTDF